MNGKRVDSFLTPPRNDSAFMVMVVIIAVTVITIGIIFSYSDEPKASNANMESRAVSPDPRSCLKGLSQPRWKDESPCLCPHLPNAQARPSLPAGGEPCFGPQRTPRSGHSTCQRDGALLSSFPSLLPLLPSHSFVEPSLEYVEALSWTPGKRGETYKSKCVGSSLALQEQTGNPHSVA